MWVDAGTRRSFVNHLMNNNRSTKEVGGCLDYEVVGPGSFCRMVFNESVNGLTRKKESMETISVELLIIGNMFNAVRAKLAMLVLVPPQDLTD